MRWVQALCVVLGVAGCQGGDPDTLVLTFGTFASSPVVLKAVSVNGTPVAYSPVIATEADQLTPRTSYTQLLDYPGAGQGGNVTVSVTWVELLTHKAWQAEVAGPVSAFARYSDGQNALRLGPVFGPNGLMILTSDPIPTSATDSPLVDVARVCGARVAALDVDHTANPEELSLTELLQANFPPVTNAECPAQD